ncbi:RNA polymerase sigma factor [Chryseolinea sp. T2]|uniref:RNA polymerase sigma factor n=1 Tax=Chryseolinea sp. T2 TaxID=3129255 RepID=UPI00307712EC
MEAIRIHDYAAVQLDDFTIIKRVLSGERELFEVLLRRYNQTLFRVIRSYLRDEDEIRDAMQNAYLKAFERLYQFRGNAAFSTWLVRIGINEALQRLKAIQRDRHAIMFDASDEIVNRIPDKQMNAEKAIIDREAKQILEQAIDRLPEKYRVVYMLKEVERLSNEQVAECLGLSDSNVKVRMHRAKILLKESLYKLSTTAEVFEFGKGRCDEMVRLVLDGI